MLDTNKTFYIAGPMTHIPQFNYPLFFRVADALRNTGYVVISPAEQDSPEKLEQILASPDGDLSKIDDEVGTWGDFLSHDVKLIADQVQGLVLLPGWQKSRGARLEAFLAILCSHSFIECDLFQDELVLSQVTSGYIMRQIYNVTA